MGLPAYRREASTDEFPWVNQAPGILAVRLDCAAEAGSFLRAETVRCTAPS